MFAAYASNNDGTEDVDEDRKDTFLSKDGVVMSKEEQQNETTRLYNKQRRKYLEEKEREMELKEAMTYRRFGATLSDSDEDDGAPKIRLPAYMCFSEKDVAKVKQKKEPNYDSFPSTSRRSRHESEDKYNMHKKLDKHRKSHKRRSRSREKKSRKKSKRHKRNSSSASGSSLSSFSSQCSKNSRQQFPRLVADKGKSLFVTKWDFITNDELNNLHRYFDTTWIVNARRFDPENYSLGFPKRELSRLKYRLQFIDGINNSSFFEEMYANDIPRLKKKKEKPFYESLSKIAKVIPHETIFRKRIIPTTDFNSIPLSLEPYTQFEYSSVEDEKKKLQDQLHDEIRQEGHLIEDESIIRAISDLETRGRAINMKLSSNPTNIKLWIEFVELQDEIYSTKKIQNIQDTRQNFLERKEAILDSAISKNRKSATLKLMKIDVMIEMGRDPNLIIDEYKNCVYMFPHECMVWVKYLDYIQYNHNIYRYDILDNAFAFCFDKIRGLIEGTLQSHVRLVKDFRFLKEFYLYVYIRYLKWLIELGCVPLALANIQATMEMNFGLGLSATGLTYNEKMAKLKQFWETKMPRIGDNDARGAENEFIRFYEMGEGLMRKLEFQDYEVSLWDMSQAVKRCLERCDRPLALSWVEFERKLLDIDGRPKRNSISFYDEEYKEDIEIIGLWSPVEFDKLRVYSHPENSDDIDFVEPILEILGYKFANSSGFWASSAQLLKFWRGNGSNSNENVKIPTIETHVESAFSKIGLNIIKYLLIHYNRENGSELPEKEVLKYLTCFILSKAEELEYDEEFPIWKLDEKWFTRLFEILRDTGVENMKGTLLPQIIKLIYCTKFVEWHRKAVKRFEEIKDEINICTKRNIMTDLYVSDSDEKRIYRKLPKFINKNIQDFIPMWKEGDESQLSKDKPLYKIQMYLMAVLLRVSLIPAKEWKSFRYMIISQIMEKGFDNFDQLEYITEEDVSKFLKNLHFVYAERENSPSDFNKFIAELPRPSIIVICLKIINEFFNLKVGINDREVVGSNCKDVLNLIGKSRSPDGKLLIDTLIHYLTLTKERRFLYFSIYKKVVWSAQMLYPSDPKYAKRYVQDLSISTVKQIELKKSLNTFRKKISDFSKENFDYRNEVLSYQTTISHIYSSIMRHNTLKDMASIKSLLKTIREEALLTRDPSIWRLALKMASNLDASPKVLDELHVLATGQCSWSRNVHIDRVETEPTNNKLSDIMLLLLEVSKNAPHAMFIDDIEVIQTHREVAELNSNQ